LQKKFNDREEEVKKKGLSATPSSTLPWSARRAEKFTVCWICILLHHIYLPVVIARPFSALPACGYATIGRTLSNAFPGLKEKIRAAHRNNGERRGIDHGQYFGRLQ